MNSPEYSAVQELERFSASLLNGMIDMDSSAADFVRYAFQARTLKDVVRRATENPELVDQIKDRLLVMLEYLNVEIVNYAGGVSEFGLENRLFTEFIKRVHLVYELALAMKMHEKYQDHELTELLDATKHAVQQTFEISSNFPRWCELNQAHREFFFEQKEQLPQEVIVEPTMFAREDGVVTSLAYEKALSDEDAKKKQFVAKTEKVLNNYRAKNPDFKTMRELIHTKTSFRLDGIHIDTLINVFVTIWDLAIEEEKEKYLFISLLKKVFMLMSDSKRNDMAMKLYDKYRTDGNDVLPCLENFIENFQSTLTTALNKLPLDSAVLSNNTNAEVFEAAKQEIVWFLLVSPGTTLQQLLMMCVDNKGYIPLVIRICRCLPTLFDRFVHLTPLPYEKEEKDLLLKTILHRVFMYGRTTWTSASQWENAGAMASSFGKNRKRKEGKPESPEDKALIDPFYLAQFAFEELIIEQRKPQKAVETVVTILKRILANNNNARMSSTYRFASGYEDTGDRVIPTPYVMHLMFELLVEFDGKSSDITEGAREILKSVGGRLQDEKVVMDDNTIFSLTGEFNGAPWWVKYAIFSWFASSLRNPKRQVPSGVYISLPESLKDDFEQIKSESETTVSEDYLKSLFELGLFDVDLAIDLLRSGTEIKFGGPDIIEKMALALVDSFGKKIAKRNGGREIGRLVAEMLRIFDPIRQLVVLQTYSSNYFESIKKIEHILVIYKAARIAKEKEMGAVRPGDQMPKAAYDELLSAKDVAEQLLDIFCETSKAHVEKESADMKALREKANAIIFSPGRHPEQWEAMRELHGKEQTLVLQLTMLYLEASHFAQFYQTAPIKLQQLMHVTLDRQFDSQKWVTKKVMDDALTETRKTEVVYAFVENPPVEQPREPEKEVVQPVKQSAFHSSKQQGRHEKENVSAENATFGMNGGDRYGRGAHGQQYGGGYRGQNHNRKYYPEHDRPTSSRGSAGGPPYRSRKNWDPVMDPQNLPPRDRDVTYLKSKFPPNNRDFDFPRRQQYESDKLYEIRGQSPVKSGDVRRSGDVRKFSESRDHESWDSSRRYPSESDYDDLESRHIDKTVRAVQQFARRDSFSSRPGTSSCSPPPQQQQGGPEGKGPKKGASYEPRSTGGFTRKPAPGFGDRKHAQRFYGGHHDFEQEEDGKKRVRQGHPAERDDFKERVPDPAHAKTTRRGGHH